MLGLLFAELKRYLEENGDASVWRDAVEAAGLQAPKFAAPHKDDDDAFYALVYAAAVRAHTRPELLLEALGERMGYDVVLSYRQAIDPSWSTIDLLERSQSLIRTVASHGGGDAAPPRFATHMDGQDAIVFDWYSPRKLCPLAKGLVRGVAGALGDPVEISESFCMFRGDDHCQMTFRALEHKPTVS